MRLRTFVLFATILAWFGHDGARAQIVPPPSGGSICTLSGSATSGYVLTSTGGTGCSWQTVGGASVDNTTLKNAWFINDLSGSANTISGTTATTFPGAYAKGQSVIVQVANTNTGATTININTLGAKAVTKNGNTALAAGNLVAGNDYLMTYDGTEFEVLTFTILAVDIPTLNQNTTGTAANLSGTPTLPNGTTATTQSQLDGSTKLATTSYTDTAVANGIAGVNPAIAVQAATTAAGDTSGLTYNNGVSGVGATLTGTANTAITIDGYTFTATGQRLLVKNDTQSPSGAFNGIYSLTTLQTSLLAPVFTRATDYDTPSNMNETGAIPVISGTANGTTQWVLTSKVSTIGTDALTYTKFTLNPSTIVISGVDINSSNQVTATHLASALPVNQGGTGTTSTLIGLMRGNASAMTAAELSGDCTTSGSNAITCTKTSGTAFGVGATATGAISPQTGTYQVLAADFTNLSTITVASGTFTVTLVASSSQPAAGKYINILNYGSGVVTIARSGQNINGGMASLTLAAASATAPTSATVWSDGTNYFSNLVAPSAAAGAITQIAQVVADGTKATYTFSSLGSYSSIHIEAYCRSANTTSGISDGLIMQVNGDTSAHYLDEYKYVTGNSEGIGGSASLTASAFIGTCPGVGTGGGTLFPGVSSTVLVGYTGSTFTKSATSTSSSYLGPSASLNVSYFIGWLWNQTSAITSITLFTATGSNFSSGTIITLYGFQ